MRNVKIYDNFLKNINSSFRIRLFKISLARTFVFNLDNKDIYYRKANVIRKIALLGKERAFLLERKLRYDINNLSLPIKKIDDMVSEYISCNYSFEEIVNDSFDIVEKNKKKVMMTDSFVRRIRRDEIVTMCFDDDSYSNLVFLNKTKGDSFYQNVNV